MRETAPLNFVPKVLDVEVKKDFRKTFGIQRSAFFILIISVIFVSVLSIGIGAVEISPWQTLSILARKIGVELPFAFTGQQESVLLVIRLPRVILGLTVGAALAVSMAIVFEFKFSVHGKGSRAFRAQSAYSRAGIGKRFGNCS